ncbi:MAG: hypothetical protein ACYC09_14515 [Bacteroidota bacterium]
MKIFYCMVFSLVLLHGQDFGYTYYTMTDFRSLGVSYNIQEFAPSGSNPLSDSLRIRITSAMPMFEYREMQARVAVGYQSYTVLGRPSNAFSVFMESGHVFSISGKEQRSGFFIPVKLSANYLRAENPHQGQRNFDIGSLGVGTGVKYRYIAKTFGLQAFAAGSLHYASVGFGTEYGSQTSLTGEIQWIFPELIFEGLTAGYRYERQAWDMSDTQLNYRRFYHGPYIGIFF